MWLCLYFPHLPLEVIQRATSVSTQPLAISSDRGAHASIISLNRAARAASLQIGMRVSAASALVADLQIHPRDGVAEDAALHNLAAWASQFTSLVSLAPHALLLEIAGSLSLFGGYASLRNTIARGVQKLGFRARIAGAPTAQAALMLARVRAPDIVRRQDLTSALSALPLRHLDLAPSLIATCASLDVHTVGELLRLPRAGLTRRFGRELIDYLDRALGRVPDPRLAYSLPACFNAKLTFPAPVSQTEALLFGIQRLLGLLQGFLRARDCGAQELNLRLIHHAPPATDIAIKLLAPQRAPQHLLTVIRERLERTALRDAVQELELSAQGLQPWQARAADLFDGHAPPDTFLFERLQARLGTQALQGVATVAQHRPEQAWRYCPPLEIDAAAPTARGERPLWLLPQPQALPCTHDKPQWHGELELQQGPERIEGGWWQEDCARDYFIARSPNGTRAWIFQERRNGAWFLHGIFS